MSQEDKKRFLERLPLFINVYFTLIVVTGLQKFAAMFQWSTNPTFSYYQPADILMPISFLAAMFSIVTAWVAYSWLIVKHPYTTDFGRFFIDICGFTLMFAIMNFSFLVGNVARNHFFTLTIAASHFLVAGWHVWPCLAHADARKERMRDARGQIVRGLTYLALGTLYFLLIVRWRLPFSETVRHILIGITFLAIFGWNTKRLLEIRTEANSQQCQERG